MTFLAKAHKPHASTKNDSNVAAPATAAFWIPASATRSPISALCTNVFLCALLKTNKKTKTTTKPPKSQQNKKQTNHPEPNKNRKTTPKNTPRGELLGFSTWTLCPRATSLSNLFSHPAGAARQNARTQSRPPGLPRPVRAAPHRALRGRRSLPAAPAGPHLSGDRRSLRPGERAPLRSARRRVAPARPCPLRRAFPASLPGPRGTPGLPPPRPPPEVSRGHVRGGARPGSQPGLPAALRLPGRAREPGAYQPPAGGRGGGGSVCPKVAERQQERSGGAASRPLAGAAPPQRRARTAPAPSPRPGARGVCGASPTLGHPPGTPRAPPGQGPLPEPPQPREASAGLPRAAPAERTRGRVPGEPRRHRPPSGRGAPATARACRCRGTVGQGHPARRRLAGVQARSTTRV